MSVNVSTNTELYSIVATGAVISVNLHLATLISSAGDPSRPNVFGREFPLLYAVEPQGCHDDVLSLGAPLISGKFL